MKNKKLVLLGILIACSVAAKFSVNSVRLGQFADINMTRAAGNTAVVGHEVTIDLSVLDQCSETGAAEVLELDQADVDQPFLKFTCTEGALNCNSCYTSTSASKTGAIMVNINGVDRWIRVFDDPN